MENSCIYNIANILETFILLKCLATQFQPKTSDKKYRQYCSLQNILFLLHKNLRAVPEKVQILFVLQGHSK